MGIGGRDWGAQVRGRLGGSRSSAGFVSVALAGMLAVGSLALVAGAPASSSLLRLINGDTWLSNRSTGQVMLANGSSARVDLRLNLGLPGHDLQVIKVGDRSVLYDATTGALSNLDVANLTVSGGILPGAAGAVDVEAVGSDVATIDRPPGQVGLEDPFSMKTLSSATLEPGLTRGVVDSRQHLWVADGSQGKLFDLHVGRGGTGAPTLQVGPTLSVTPGADQLGLADDNPVVYSPQDSTLDEVSGDRIVRKVKIPVSSGASPLLPQMTTGPLLPIIVNPQGGLVLVSGDQVQQAQLPRGDSYQAAVAFANRVYVPDEATGTVLILNGAGQQVAPPISLPAGSLNVTVDAGRLWVDDTGDNRAVVVDPDGAARMVNKGEGNAVPVSKPAHPSTVPTDSSLPAPRFNPQAPGRTGGVSPQGPGLLGGGASPAPTVPRTPTKGAGPATTAPASTTPTTTPLPGAPTVTSDPTGGNQTITFGVSCATSCLKGGTLLGYRPTLVPTPTGGQPALLPATTGAAQAFTVDHLDVGTSYAVELAAQTTGGTGPAVTLGQATTFGKAAVSVSAQAGGDGRTITVTTKIASQDSTAPKCTLTIQGVVSGQAMSCSGGQVGVPTFNTQYSVTVDVTTPEGSVTGAAGVTSGGEAADADATSNFGPCGVPGATVYCGPSSSLWPTASDYNRNHTGEIGPVTGGTTVTVLCASTGGANVNIANASYQGAETSTTWFKTIVPGLRTGYMNQLWFAGRGGLSTAKLPSC